MLTPEALLLCVYTDLAVAHEPLFCFTAELSSTRNLARVQVERHWIALAV